MIENTNQRQFNTNLYSDSIESVIWWLEARQFETAIMMTDRMLETGKSPGKTISPEERSKILGLKGVALASMKDYAKAIPLLREGLKHSNPNCIQAIKICLSNALYEDTLVKFYKRNLPIPPELVREIIEYSEDVLEFYDDNKIYGNLGHAYLITRNYFEAAKCFHTKIRHSNNGHNAADLANLATAVGMLPGGFEKSKAIFDKAFLLADMEGDDSVIDYITETFNGIEQLHNNGAGLFFYAPPPDPSRN